MNKHILVLAMVLAVLSPLMASRWKTYTNTTHVNDYVEANNKLYIATWGGLAEFNHNPQLSGADAYELVHTYTNIDGLTNNDVRVLDYIPETDHLWMGLYAGGVNILTPTGIKIVNENSGLPSNKITGIAHSDSLFFVATDHGLAVFYQLAQVSFPLLRQVYNNAGTQGGLLNDGIKCMKLSSANYLYMGTSSGLSYVHIDSLSYNLAWHKWTVENDSGIPGNDVIQISSFNQKIAVSTTSGLGYVDLETDPTNWTIFTSVNGLASNFVYAINYSDAGELYFSYGDWNEETMTLKNTTNIVLSVIRDGTITTISEGDSGLDNKAITQIKNVNSNISLGSWGDGLYLNQGVNWYNLKTNCIGFNTVSCITRSNDKMWLGSGVLNVIKTRKGTRGMSSFDGTSWQTFTVKNSPLVSDNILTIGVDEHDRIWSGSFYIPVPNEYGWDNGLSIYDQVNGTWDKVNMNGVTRYNETTGNYEFLKDNPQLLSNALSYIYKDLKNRMFVCNYNGGVNVMDANKVTEDSLYQDITSFQIPNSATQGVLLVAESETDYFFGTANDRGLSYWSDKNLLPGSENNFWHNPPSSELNNCWVYGVVSFTNDFGENEVWIAASNGVYSYNGTKWFRYDTDIKRRVYQSGSWVTDVNGLYYVDEERLFGSVRTNPTAIFLDPFRRIWIGSNDNGFSMYDPSTERFTNYSITNSPLISNRIVSLGYEPTNGELYIGTPDGLNTLQIGIEQPPPVNLNKVRVFPNPFKPDQGQKVTLENTSVTGTFPPGKNICRIYDLSGELVMEVKQNLFYAFIWNGNNSSGKKCSSGVYYYVITTADGETARGKIALIRG